MWYGKEPFNLRLTLLRMVSGLPHLLGITLLGTLVFGGGYCVKNILLQGEPVYKATSVYHVEYAVEEEKDVGTVYINAVSWNTYLKTDLFLDAVQQRVAALDKQELASMLSAALASDLRVPSTIVTGENPETVTLVARAVEETMVNEMAEELREVVSISVVDSGDEAEEVIPDVRPVRAIVLSAVLSGFFAVVLFLIKETWEDAIWLPASIWKRYGVQTAGYLSEDGDGILAENLSYFFQNKEKIAICPVAENVNPAAILTFLKESCPETVGDGWFAVPAPRMEPEICRRLREAEGILLAVPAGAHSGRKVEQVLEYLQQQDCQVTAAVLADADESLIRWYYRMGK